MSVESFAFALAFVFGFIQVSASIRLSNAATMFFTTTWSWAFASGGKCRSTYSRPTASPSASLVIAIARSHRCRIFGVPERVLP
jgi:hypothetical protein